MQNSVWDEHELVRRCKEGSEAAYAELVRQHGGRLVTLAYRLTGSRETAEDVVQETFLAAFRAMERFEPRPALAPWLTTIAVRFASRAVSRRAGRWHVSLDRLLDGSPEDGAPAAGTSVPEPASSAADPSQLVELAELGRELEKAIAALPFNQRVAVVLRLVLGYEYADAAQSMGVPLNTFKSHLLRGTRALRLALAAHLGGRVRSASMPVVADRSRADGRSPFTVPAGAAESAVGADLDPSPPPERLGRPWLGAIALADVETERRPREQEAPGH